MPDYHWFQLHTLMSSHSDTKYMWNRELAAMQTVGVCAPKAWCLFCNASYPAPNLPNPTLTVQRATQVLSTRKKMTSLSKSDNLMVICYGFEWLMLNCFGVRLFTDLVTFFLDLRVIMGHHGAIEVYRQTT